MPRWRLRQVALLTYDETPIADALCREFGLSVAYCDPVLSSDGMRNAITPMGTAFLEVTAPANPEVPTG